MGHDRCIGVPEVRLEAPDLDRRVRDTAEVTDANAFFARTAARLA